ncbi:MAG TPA: molecular chaperone TorD family protein [Hyphomicrobiaceae bacterium]|nr:molecular chaperone TorD family protein [Hyphomicrobiaceae bacterium]
MREDGLRLAIEAAGGVGALARGLGIKQPSVSTWQRVPAERVLAVEALTGVRRERLRPDLYGEGRVGPSAMTALDQADEIERARASEYLLLANLLRSAPSGALLEEIAGLTGDATPLGMAHIALAEAAAKADVSDVESEYFALFIGIGRGELLPYASYYLTGFLHERPLARLREELQRLGIERAESNFDPEDHLGILFEIMGGFANGTFPADLEQQKGFFERHIRPWAFRFFDDLAAAKSARFYTPVAEVGRTFLSVECEAFALE